MLGTGRSWHSRICLMKLSRYWPIGGTNGMGLWGTGGRDAYYLVARVLLQLSRTTKGQAIPTGVGQSSISAAESSTKVSNTR